ncbi:MAG: hypothetical protein R3E34_14335 [Rhodocyclaceae bacterium]
MPPGPIDDALDELGLQRDIATTVGGFSTAVALARASELIASVPERHTGNLRADMHSFALPFAAPKSTRLTVLAPQVSRRPGAAGCAAWSSRCAGSPR